MKYPKEIRNRIEKNKAYSDLIELQKFVDYVESAYIIDYDGHGYPSDGQIYLKPEGLSIFKIYDLLEETNPNNKNKKWNWTHIIWFNK